MNIELKSLVSDSESLNQLKRTLTKLLYQIPNNFDELADLERHWKIVEENKNIRDVEKKLESIE